MKKLLILLSLTVVLGACQTQKLPKTYNAVQYVDPQIGSVHGRWFFYTPAALPFGMAKLAPHTNAYESIGSWLPGGYDNRHNSIEGFGHFHEFQVGGVVVMPTVGELKTIPGTLENPDEGYVETYPEYAKFCDPGNHVKMYFIARLSKTPDEVGTFVDSETEPGKSSTKGVRNGIYVTFGTHENEVVEMLYNQGNQPCLHQSWLFNYSGKPWLTQKWTRIIRDEFYGTEPLHGYGFGQDEDQGQLGAWYVMAALGLFDVQGHAGANPTFQFGSPQFDKVTIQLSNDPSKKLVIESKNNPAENYYVKELIFNDEEIENSWITRDRLMQGGKLTFTMDSIPNKNRGVTTPPPSMNDKL